jgi:APA family basic amino acid/polyamine antiporter
MVGAGVFAVFAPAARLAGAWLPVAVLVAGAVAILNAVAIGALGGRYPGAGGGYVCCRLLLAPWAGRLAAVLLLAGCAAAAGAGGRVFAGYVLPSAPLYVAVPVVLLGGVGYLAGVRPSGRGGWLVTCGVVAVLLVVVLVGLTSRAGTAVPVAGVAVGAAPGRIDGFGVSAAAGLVSFAFLGYPGVATFYRGPVRSSAGPGRVVPIALVTVTLIYLGVAGALLHGLGLSGLGDAGSELAAAVGANPALGVLVRVGAAAASALTVLAALTAAGRTVGALHRRGELPGRPVHGRARGTPWPAQLVVLLAAVAVTALSGPAPAMALSGCCLLSYFALLNLAVLRMRPSRSVAAAALLALPACLLLAATQPRPQLLVTAAVFAAGLGWPARRAQTVSPVPQPRPSRPDGPVRPGPRSWSGRRRAGRR